MMYPAVDLEAQEKIKKKKEIELWLIKPQNRW